MRGALGAIGGAAALAAVSTAPSAGLGTAAVDAAAIATRERERRGALLSSALRLGFLGQDDPREDGVERQLLVAENDPDGVEALVEAVEKLSAKIHLGDGVLDVGGRR